MGNRIARRRRDEHRSFIDLLDAAVKIAVMVGVAFIVAGIVLYTINLR